MKRTLDEIRDWPTWSKWGMAIFLILLVIGVAGSGSDTSKPSPEAETTAQKSTLEEAEPEAAFATTASVQPAQTIEDAAAKVDDGDYKAAVVIAAAVGGDAESRIRHKISRHLARSVRVSLRAGDRSKARRLLARANRFPATANIRAARTDYRAAQARAAARVEQRRLARVAARQRAADRRAARREARERREQELALAAAEPEEPSGGDCHASYSPCIPTDRDYDCGELSGPYDVTGPDEYRLDADSDGSGCE